MSKSDFTWELIQDCVSSVLIFSPHVIKKSDNIQKSRKQKGRFLNTLLHLSCFLWPCPCGVFGSTGAVSSNTVSLEKPLAAWKGHALKVTEVGGDWAGVADCVPGALSVESWKVQSQPWYKNQPMNPSPALAGESWSALPVSTRDASLPAPWSWAFRTLWSLSWDPHDTNWKQDLGEGLLVKLKLVSTEGNVFAAFPPVLGARADGQHSWAGNRFL